MLVVFWSPLKGHGKVTSAVLSTGCTLAVEYKASVLLVDSRGSGGIEKGFEQLKGKGVDYSSYGIRAVETLLSSGKLAATGIQSRCSYIIRNRLDYLDTQDVSRSVVDRVLAPALERGKTEYDMRFVDMGGGELSDMEKDLLSRADLVVVCVPQHIDSANVAMTHVTALAPDKKKLICVADYEHNASTSLKKIAQALNVPVKDVHAIPHNVGLLDSLNDKHVMGFFQRVQTIKKSLFKMTDDELCITKIRELTKRLLIMIELAPAKENE